MLSINLRHYFTQSVTLIPKSLNLCNYKIKKHLLKFMIDYRTKQQQNPLI